MTEPTIQEIMEFHRLTLKVICNAETLPEAEIEKLDELEKKTQGFDFFEIMNDRIADLERKLNVAREALGFYGNIENMYDNVYDSDERSMYIPDEADFEYVCNYTIKHIGKRARAALKEIGE